MKKLIVILSTLLIANSAFAWGDFERGITTGVAGLWLYNRLSQPTYQVQQTQPVIVQQNPQMYPGPVAYPNYPNSYSSHYPVYVERQTCGQWSEIQNPDGTISRSRTCN